MNIFNYCADCLQEADIELSKHEQGSYTFKYESVDFMLASVGKKSIRLIAYNIFEVCSLNKYEALSIANEINIKYPMIKLTIEDESVLIYVEFYAHKHSNFKYELSHYVVSMRNGAVEFCKRMKEENDMIELARKLLSC